jgi:hypothetical protein
VPHQKLDPRAGESGDNFLPKPAVEGGVLQFAQLVVQVDGSLNLEQRPMGLRAPGRSLSRKSRRGERLPDVLARTRRSKETAASCRARWRALDAAGSKIPRGSRPT